GMFGAAHARASGKLLLAYESPEERAAYLQSHPLQPITARTIVETDPFIAELEKIAGCGYSIDNGEFAEGVACISAPVFDAAREVIAAVTISAPDARFHENEERLRDAILGMTQEASHEYGWRGTAELASLA